MGNGGEWGMMEWWKTLAAYSLHHYCPIKIVFIDFCYFISL
jgi:hypothetical protein